MQECNAYTFNRPAAQSFDFHTTLYWDVNKQHFTMTRSSKNSVEKMSYYLKNRVLPYHNVQYLFSMNQTYST